MQTLLPILITSLLLAYLIERTTVGKYGAGRQTSQNELLFILLITVLAMPVGLRRIYNDTGAYISGFQNSLTTAELFASDELHILQNPAFLIYRSLVHTYTDNYHIFFMIPAFFVQYSFVRFIRKYSPSFILGIGLYILLGTYVFSFAAMKQTIAMAVLLLGITYLLNKKYAHYFAFVFVAFLFHTYAISFLILPLFTVRPWSVRTFILIFSVLFIINNFETSI